MLNSWSLIAELKVFEISNVSLLLHRHPPLPESSKQLILSRRLDCVKVVSSGSAGSCRASIFSYNAIPKPH